MVLEEALEILKSHGAIARVDWEYRHLRMIGCTVYYVTREWRTNSGYVWVDRGGLATYLQGLL